MSSGNKSLIFNSQERVISPDHNRSQSFRDAEVAEIMRSLHNTDFGTDDDDIALESDVNTLTAPLRAEILRGLMAQPQVASTAVLVTPGVGFMVAPDNVADDSSYKFVQDPGITSAGALAIAANPTGSIRIDVVECQWSGQVIETDNRDVLNLVTGAFSPQLVSKVSAGRLTYRVRQGTAGGGFPGMATGWLPLCVASVPAGSTNNDTVTFWDVRPMVSDREYSGFNLDSKWLKGRAPYVEGHVDAAGLPTDVRLWAVSDARFGGRRVGGRLRRGSPGTDIDYLALNDLANQDGTLGAVNWPVQTSGGSNGLSYLYLVFPHGLPRWARYTDASTVSRKPRAPKGIPLLSITKPNMFGGRPASALTMPAVYGFGSYSTLDAVLIAPLLTISGALGGVWENNLLGNWTLLNHNGLVSINMTDVGSGNFDLQMIPGTTYPAAAKELLIKITGQTSPPIAVGAQVSWAWALEVYQGTTATGTLDQYINLGNQYRYNPGIGGNTYTFDTTWPIIRVPIRRRFDGANGAPPASQLYRWASGISVGTMNAVRLRVAGWRL